MELKLKILLKAVIYMIPMILQDVFNVVVGIHKMGKVVPANPKFIGQLYRLILNVYPNK